MRTTNYTVTAAVVSIGGLLCLSSVILATSSEEEGSKVFRLQILHTNDLHSHFAEFNNEGTSCSSSEICFGGFPRLKTAIQTEKEKMDEDPDVGLLVLNAGDTFQGTMFYTKFKWQIVAEMLSNLTIDAMCLGNHEFDDGVDPVNSFVTNLQNNISVVVSNIDMSKEPGLREAQKIITKSKILTVKDRKIGIIGYLTPETKKLENVGKVEFMNEVLSIRKEARRLKDEGIKIIIALGHSGFEMDKKIALEVEDIDVVVGGHSHTFLYNGKQQSYMQDRAAGPYPFCVTRPKTYKQVPVVQAFQNGKYLGKLSVEFDEDGEVLNSFGNPVLMDNSIVQDPTLLSIVQNYEIEINKTIYAVIGSTDVLLEGYYCKLRECNFGNFITDAYVKYNVKISKDFDTNEFWTDAPIALQEAGGIRTDINSGNITYGQLTNAMPFNNSMIKVSMTGSDIQKTFETAFMNYDGIKWRSEFLQVSGLKIEVDLSKERGNRVMSIKVKSTLKDNGDNYELLDPEKKYKVIMNDYIFNGGNGFKFDKTLEFTEIGNTNFKIVLEEIKEKKIISPEVEDRIVFINAKHNITVNNSVPSFSQESQEYISPGCGKKFPIEL